MMTPANLPRWQGELKEALQIMEILEEMAPEEPVALFNLAALMLQVKKPERARDYFDRIDPGKTTEELRSKLEELEEELGERRRGILSPLRVGTPDAKLYERVSPGV